MGKIIDFIARLHWLWTVVVTAVFGVLTWLYTKSGLIGLNWAGIVFISLIISLSLIYALWALSNFINNIRYKRGFNARGVAVARFSGASWTDIEVNNVGKISRISTVKMNFDIGYEESRVLPTEIVKCFDSIKGYQANNPKAQLKFSDKEVLTFFYHFPLFKRTPKLIFMAADSEVEIVLEENIDYSIHDNHRYGVVLNMHNPKIGFYVFNFRNILNF